MKDVTFEVVDPDAERMAADRLPVEVVTRIPNHVRLLTVYEWKVAYFTVNRMFRFRAKLMASCTCRAVVALTT